ncbi:MAG: GldG family protein [Myxococcota bacterium]|jgi:hypothetical protein|nr:GldG family protein [Myxococcota bacterium]
MSDKHASGPSPHARAGLNVLVSVLGLAAILLGINYLSLRHYVRADWTSGRLYTLSDKTLKVLRSLDKDVKIHVVWGKRDPAYSKVKGVLDRYAAASKRMAIEIVDPDLSRDRLELLIGQYGAKLTDMGGGALAMEATVIVVSGDNVKFVGAADFEEHTASPMDAQDMDGEESHGFLAEQALTSAILTVTSDQQGKLCFTQGHDERSFIGMGPHTLGNVKEALQHDGLKAEPLTTQGLSRIPQSCTAVVVAGPGKAFLEEEAAVLASYVDKGGKLLLLLDPIIDENRIQPTGLEKLCRERGIELGADVLIETDARRLLSNSPLTFLASETTSHAAVKHLQLGAGASPDQQAYPVVFSLVRSVSPNEEAKIIAEPLAKTSKDSWGETDIASLAGGAALPVKDQTDTQGPVTFGMAATIGSIDGKTHGELLVLGDSDFLEENLFVSAGLSNRDLWSGLVGHLVEKHALVSIAPKDPKAASLTLSGDDLRRIELALLACVLSFAVLGVMVFMRRRR